jgi:hypothetical protein
VVSIINDLPPGLIYDFIEARSPLRGLSFGDIELKHNQPIVNFIGHSGQGQLLAVCLVAKGTEIESHPT